MNRRVGRVWSLLKANVWFIGAFFVPFAIRSLPEILSWPYLLGLDTLTVVDRIQSSYVLLSGPLVFVKNQLFYHVATLANWLVGDPIITLKLFGPILMGLISVMMYLVARRVLGWSGFKSFFVAFIVGIYFVSLRNSWDLYAQSFALIFLFGTLLSFELYSSPKRYLLVLVFMILTVFSHELVSVILFVIIGLEFVHLALKEMRRDLIFFAIVSVLAISFFIFRLYSPTTGSITIPSGSVADVPSLNLALQMSGLLVYCYGLLLPFTVIGFKFLKNRFLRFWSLWCIGAIVGLIFFPTLPLYFWGRWVFLLVYPLLFFTVEGLDRLWKYQLRNRSKISRLFTKTVAITYILLLLTLSGFYLTANPNNQISFFSSSNPYLSHIPSSMLQNALPIDENPSIVSCFNWINNDSPNNSTLIAHYALYDLAKIYVHERSVVRVAYSQSVYLQNETSFVQNIVEASRTTWNAGNRTVYTVWWIDGKGWYSISSLPSNFFEVYRSGDIAVYEYQPAL